MKEYPELITRSGGLALRLHPETKKYYWQDRNGFGDLISKDFDTVEAAYLAFIEDDFGWIKSILVPTTPPGGEKR